MKKTIAFLLTFAILLTGCIMGQVSIQAATLQRHMIADWDDPDYSPAAPATAAIAVPDAEYEFGNALITGTNIINFTSYADAAGDTMLAMRVKLSSAVTPGTAHWTSLLFYGSDFPSRPRGIESGKAIYYIPAADNQTDFASYTAVSDGLYKVDTANYNIRLEYGYEGWIVISLADINVDWWGGQATVAGAAAEQLSALHILADFPEGSVLDEIQTFSGDVESFKSASAVKPENDTMYRNLLADWDDTELSPAAPANSSIDLPYAGYPFGNGLLTAGGEIALIPNTAAAGDTMIAFRIKNFELSVGDPYWSQIFLVDDTGRPKALMPGSNVYYIPTVDKTARMDRFTNIVGNIFRYTTTSETIGIEKGYSGWIVMSLSDFTKDWWSGGTANAPAADKITKINLASGFASGTLIDEIQTFDGSLRTFAANCGQKAAGKPFIRTVLADWDYAGFSPAAPNGASIGVPYDGYAFGNALLTGMKTIPLNPNAKAAGDNMLAMWIKDSSAVTPGVAHWTKFLFHSSDYNRPQALQPGKAIYYIPAANNGTDMSIYTQLGGGVYAKNTENTDIRIDYGYEGWIIIDLNYATLDWWNSLAPMEPIAADKITVIDIVADLADGTALDEIQTFSGSVSQFAKVCSEKVNVVVDRSAEIGTGKIGDFNGDGSVDIRDLVSLKKRIANGSEWDKDTDIYVDGAFNAMDLSLMRRYLLGIL